LFVCSGEANGASVVAAARSRLPKRNTARGWPQSPAGRPGFPDGGALVQFAADYAHWASRATFDCAIPNCQVAWVIRLA
jgi:hypothetical protein